MLTDFESVEIPTHDVPEALEGIWNYEIPSNAHKNAKDYYKTMKECQHRIVKVGGYQYNLTTYGSDGQYHYCSAWDLYQNGVSAAIAMGLTRFNLEEYRKLRAAGASSVPAPILPIGEYLKDTDDADDNPDA